jgi:hypothetical protein
MGYLARQVARKGELKTASQVPQSNVQEIAWLNPLNQALYTAWLAEFSLPEADQAIGCPVIGGRCTGFIEPHPVAGVSP